MRGLLGDATEDMIEKLDDGKDKSIDDEEEYKMAAVLSQCEGLDAVMWRLACVRDFIQGHQLISAALKLLDCCTKLKVSRERRRKAIPAPVPDCIVMCLCSAGEQATPPAATSEHRQYPPGSLQPGAYRTSLASRLALPPSLCPALFRSLFLLPFYSSPSSLMHFW